MADDKIRSYREFLKDSLRLKIDFTKTDQNQGIKAPALQKPPLEEQALISLPDEQSFDVFRGTDLLDAITLRRSHRRYLDQPVSLIELSWLLWSTQGIIEVLSPECALRTVPSAGCRHAFETYILVRQVESLENAIYRYLPVDHSLVLEYHEEDLLTKLYHATLGQAFITSAALSLIWTAIPYRMEWRYGLAAHRVIAMDIGHVCQNLYLACSAINAGTCGVAAYHQQKMDSLLRVDGECEFTIYLAPVGKIVPLESERV